MFRQALFYPVRGPNTEGVFLPGLIVAFATAISLSFPSVLALVALVPGVVLVGFLGRIYADTIQGGTEPPTFGSLSAVARTGVRVTIVAAVYLLPAAVLLAITLAGVLSTTTDPGSLSFGSSMRVLAGSTAVLVAILAALYLVPAAVGNALETDSIRNGLSVRALGPVASDGAYFTAFWGGVILLSGTLVVVATVASLGRAGAAAGVVVTFYGLLGATHLVGRGYRTENSLYDLF